MEVNCLRDTIYDYVDFRGDLLSYQFSYNELDYLVFSILSYIDFNDVVGIEPITINEAYQRLTQLEDYPQRRQKGFLRCYKIFDKMAYSPRYKDIKLAHYQNDINENKEAIQFAAITLILQDGTLFISYSGTDETLIGWRENFDLLYKKTIPSHKKAIE